MSSLLGIDQSFFDVSLGLLGYSIACLLLLIFYFFWKYLVSWFIFMQ